MLAGSWSDHSVGEDWGGPLSEAPVLQWCSLTVAEVLPTRDMTHFHDSDLFHLSQ
jgi:hypothetical protein